jgi:hypothetical protein
MDGQCARERAARRPPKRSEADRLAARSYQGQVGVAHATRAQAAHAFAAHVNRGKTRVLEAIGVTSSSESARGPAFATRTPAAGTGTATATAESSTSVTAILASSPPSTTRSAGSTSETTI